LDASVQNGTGVAHCRVRMQLSRFVVTYEDVRQDEHVLYNVLTDHYIGIDSATLQAVRRWTAGSAPAGHEEAETARVLHDESFLVDDRGADDQRLREHLEKSAQGMPGTLYLTLMPTLACNLACTYCFQKELPAFNRMTDANEAATLEWILARIDESACRKLMVHYFGGEPLTRKDYVLRTARSLSAAMRARGGEFGWEITTNGINLDVTFVAALNECGKGAIKVTLDGDQETHDRYRVWRSGKGTFEQIFANVVAVAPHVRLRIGGNFAPGERASYEKLLARLDAAGLSGKLDAVKFKPVENTSRQSVGTCTGCSHSQQEDAQTLVQLNRSIQKRKLGIVHQETLEGLLGPCELHWTNSYVVDPDGYVYKCPAVAGRSEMAVAHVGTGGQPKPAPLVASRPWDKCGDCAYLPVCVGGCLGGQYLKTGRTDQVNCKLEQFEASFRDTIPQRYLAELGEADWSTAA
jgi:uncharacterized protein